MAELLECFARAAARISAVDGFLPGSDLAAGCRRFGGGLAALFSCCLSLRGPRPGCRRCWAYLPVLPEARSSRPLLPPELSSQQALLPPALVPALARPSENPIRCRTSRCCPIDRIPRAPGRSCSPSSPDPWHRGTAPTRARGIDHNVFVGVIALQFFDVFKRHENAKAPMTDESSAQGLVIGIWSLVIFLAALSRNIPLESRRSPPLGVDHCWQRKVYCQRNVAGKSKLSGSASTVTPPSAAGHRELPRSACITI